VYGEQAGNGADHFFQRWYDEEHLTRLVGAAPSLDLRARRVMQLDGGAPGRAYQRFFPASAVFSPLLPLALRHIPGATRGIVVVSLQR